MVILRQTADRALFGKADTRPPPCAAAFRLIDRRILVDRFRRLPDVFGGARDQAKVAAFVDQLPHATDQLDSMP